MKSAWFWLAPTLALGFAAFGGCGGTSGGGDASSAGSGGSRAGAGAGGAMIGGASSAGESNLEECNKSECGPQLGIANWTCADGSIGGPTGRCLRRPGGTCGWEINNCPPAGQGGAAGEGGATPQGGQANAAGEANQGGTGSDDCGGCSPGHVCVFQLGGPGPSHFVCATQNPCGAAGACACIVGQGTCQPNLMGDPPRYCECQNNLK